MDNSLTIFDMALEWDVGGAEASAAMSGVHPAQQDNVLQPLHATPC